RADVERGELEPFALLRGRTGGRREAFALCEGALERGQPLLEETDVLVQRLPLGPDTFVEDTARLLQLGAQTGEQRLRGLPPERDPLAGAAQPVQSGGRAFAPARRPGELLLDSVSLLEQRFELRLDLAPRDGAGL